MYKLLARKLLGKNYSNVLKNLLIAAVIGFSLSSLDTKVDLAQSVLILTSIVYSGFVVFRTLSSKDNMRTIKGVFAMPYNGKKALWEYTAAIGMYTVFTKTVLLVPLLFAFTTLTPLYILLLVLSTIYAVVGVMALFSCLRRAPAVSLLIAAAGVCMAFFLPKGYIAAAILAAADIAAAAVLSVQPFDSFYVRESAHFKVKARKGKPNMLILRYITRFFLANKNYILSSAVIIVFSCFLARMFEQQGIKLGFGLALAMISTNTPISIIVSSNRSLKTKLDALPNKTRSFFVPYSVIVFFLYTIFYALFITAYAVTGGTVELKWIITAVAFALQCAVFVSLLEDRFTLTKWNTEPDLWHHPRKYIVPCVLLLEASLISMI